MQVNSIRIKSKPFITTNKRYQSINFESSKLPLTALATIKETNSNLYKTYITSLYKQNSVINFSQIQELGIPDLKLVYNRGVRGETLSASKNYKHLSAIRQAGIDTIIDLRTSDFTKNFKPKCEQYNFKYFHIPIDKKNEPDRNILNNLPILFELLKRGKFYIACAQGKHRTDIALAINYVFNPAEKVPPFMSGHTKKYITDMEDISRRLNSLYKAMTSEDRIKLKWPNDYDETFQYKKRVLRSYSESKSSPT